MAKPDNGDMQCRAVLDFVSKRSLLPERCTFLRTEIPDQRGTWSKYCLGHRNERARLWAVWNVEKQGDRPAPPTIRTFQTQRDLWVFPGDGKWKQGDRI